MANPEWNAIFRSFSDEELVDKIAELKSQMTVLSTQAIGNKSLTRDLRELRDQLSSAVFVQNERRQPPGENNGWGITDFSQIR